MAIVIIDGFDVRHAGPIDGRIVATSSVERVAMGLTSIGQPYSFVYDGLKCFQLNDRSNWVWNASIGTWSLDVVSGNVSGTPSRVPYVPYWTSVGVLGSGPLHVTQSGLSASTGIQVERFIYFGQSISPSARYESIIGMSDTNWLTLASSNTLRGIQIRNASNLTDKINSGGQVTHQLAGNTTWASTTVFNSSGYLLSGMTGSIADISSNQSLNISTEDNSGKNITIKAAQSSQGSIYLLGGNGAVPGDIQLMTSTGSGLYSGNISIKTNNNGYAPGVFGGLIKIDGPMKRYSSLFSNTTVVSTTNTNLNVDETTDVYIVNNTGASNITLGLPDLFPQVIFVPAYLDGRNITIQCSTFSASIEVKSVGTINPSKNRIYYNGIFNNSIFLYRGQSINIISSKQNWYVISKNFPDETWKTIGNGGIMQNGQAVPSFSVNFTTPSIYSTLQIRKTGNNRLGIRGGLSSVNGTTSVLQLPIGYIPISSSHDFIARNITTDAVVMMRIASNWIYCETGFTIGDEIRIPDMEIPLD